MLQEPSNLQQWICQLAQEQCEDVVRVPEDLEREVEQSGDCQDVVELHDGMFAMHEAPEQVEDEIAHAVGEDQRADHRIDLD